MRAGSKRVRPFSHTARVYRRGGSRPLQRVVTDFGADVPFAAVVDKLVEHYGVLVNESMVRRITQWHGEQMFSRYDVQDQWPEEAGVERVIGEMDGSMVSIMVPDSTQEDQRKGKQLFWKEAKLSLAHCQGSRDVTYGGTLQGGAEEAGRRLLDCAVWSGFGGGSELHAVGDGAEWVAIQVEEQFGSQGRYLLDFYHACTYLSVAAKSIYPDPSEAKAWLSRQKERLKTDQAAEVIEALTTHWESEALPDAQAPVRCCHRYLVQRLDQLFYREAQEKALPVGSGEIESAHRHVIQQRLKRPGAWWRIENAEHMLALHLNRANGQWSGYWAEERRQAA